MPLQGFGVGAANGKAPPESDEPDFRQLVRDESRLAARLAPPRVLRRWKSSTAPQQGTTAGFQKSGTPYIVNTDRDEINCLTVTVLSGTLWVFLQEADPSASSIPDMVFGALVPVQPIEIPVPLDRYFVTLFASGADCQYSVIAKAI